MKLLKKLVTLIFTIVLTIWFVACKNITYSVKLEVSGLETNVLSSIQPSFTINDGESQTINLDSNGKANLGELFKLGDIVTVIFQDVDKYITPETIVHSVAGDYTIISKYIEIPIETYTITWKNYDGTILETDTNVAFESIPTYDGETPTKEEDSQYSYTFDDWTPTINNVVEDAIYIATYISIPIMPDTDMSFFEFSYLETTDSYEVSGFKGGLSTIVIPSTYKNKSVTSIGYHAFYDWSLTSIVIPNGVTSIGDGSFSNCSILTTIIIPNSVTKIGLNAFYMCSSLTNITIPNNVTSIGENAFNGCSSLTNITIPNGITSIGDGTFAFCESLTSIKLPDSLISIESNAFFHCSSINNIELSPNNSEYHLLTLGSGKVVSTSITWDSDSKVVSSLAYGDITIPNGITSIGEYAFYFCNSITSIIIPEGVKSIGEYAFYNCSSLKSIIIPEGVTSIGEYAFFGNFSLITVTMPNSLRTIGRSAFFSCSSLTNITLSDGLTVIGDFAFSYCESLTSIIMPDSVTSIGNYVFSDCESLTSVTIGNGVTTIGNSAFSYCSSLIIITIPNGVTTIGNSAFYHCTSLKSVIIPNSVTSIGNSAFEYCRSLTTVIIPNSITSIGAYAFRYCSSLPSITIPSSVDSIGEYAFYDCTALTIYCRILSKPSDWDERWVSGFIFVYWGYTGEYVK